MKITKIGLFVMAVISLVATVLPNPKVAHAIDFLIIFWITYVGFSILNRLDERDE